MNVLITGAQFKNKGAQSLLFTVMNELRQHYGDVEIYYLPIDDCFSYPSDTYRFHVVFDDLGWLDYRYDPWNELRNIKHCISKYHKWSKKHKETEILRLSQVLKKLDAIINVSGYSLTSKFIRVGNYRYLRVINEAKRHKIPMFLMPQSFGPFDYRDKKKMTKKIKRGIEKVDAVFARETEGRLALKNEIGVSNDVLLSPDVVLQSHSLKLENIYVKTPELHIPELGPGRKVGIVPNVQVLKNGNKNDILNLYRKIIEKLISLGQSVYIFRHSNDLDMCKMIYQGYEDNCHVHLIEDDLNCIEYEEFIKQFDYIIASRFHSIVHAYKQGIPAIILGWAVKYIELANAVSQEQYVFDGTDISNEQVNAILEKIRNMNDKYSDESQLIKERVKAIQNNSCFNTVYQIIDRR